MVILFHVKAFIHLQRKLPILRGRKLGTNLHLIHPRVKRNVNGENRAVIKERVQKSQEKQKAYRDRKAEMREFEIEDHV